MHPKLSGYLAAMIKLALQDYPSREDPRYASLVDRVVRMPGPAEAKRKYMNSTSMPTEVSKSQAQQQLHTSGEVAADVKTHRIEGIN